MTYETPPPEELVLPMPDDEYVSWLLTDRYGCNIMEEQAVLNFYNMISSAAGWEEKELITLKTLAIEKGKV
jgi:hypothetical protein